MNKGIFRLFWVISLALLPFPIMAGTLYAQDNTETAISAQVWATCDTLAYNVESHTTYDEHLRLHLTSGDEIWNIPFDLSNTGIAGASWSSDEVQPPVQFTIEREDEVLFEGEAQYLCASPSPAEVEVVVSGACEPIEVSFALNDTEVDGNELVMFVAWYGHKKAIITAHVNDGVLEFDFTPDPDKSTPLEWQFITPLGISEGVYIPGCETPSLFPTPTAEAWTATATLAPTWTAIPTFTPTVTAVPTIIAPSVTPSPGEAEPELHQVIEHEISFVRDCDAKTLFSTYRKTERLVVGDGGQFVKTKGLENNEKLLISEVAFEGFALTIQDDFQTYGEGPRPLAISVQQQNGGTTDFYWSVDTHYSRQFFSQPILNSGPINVIVDPSGGDTMLLGTVPGCDTGGE